MSRQKAVVAVSGGMDSATVLGMALAEGQVVYPVGFSYPSKHNRYEQRAASNILRHYGMLPADLYQFNLTGIFEGFKSALLDKDQQVPEGHYEAENMRQTVVPGRNIIFASILAGYAWSIGADSVWLGIHAGDHFIYPDCRPDFFSAMNAAVLTGTDGNVVLHAPFLSETKKEILRWGFDHRVPYHLTRTCYKDQPIACGRCGSCQERLAAFAAFGVEDPIEYESREPLPK
jgi:7-cyano-7-deazaguanine synthase